MHPEFVQSLMNEQQSQNALVVQSRAAFSYENNEMIDASEDCEANSKITVLSLTVFEIEISSPYLDKRKRRYHVSIRVKKK